MEAEYNDSQMAAVTAGLDRSPVILIQVSQQHSKRLHVALRTCSPLLLHRHSLVKCMRLYLVMLEALAAVIADIPDWHIGQGHFDASKEPCFEIVQMVQLPFVGSCKPPYHLA